MPFSPANATRAAPSNAMPELTARPRSPLKAEDISARAYAIWERRGRRDGEHEQNWFAACEELEQERTSGAGMPALTPRSDDRR